MKLFKNNTEKNDETTNLTNKDKFGILTTMAIIGWYGYTLGRIIGECKAEHIDE